jgi:hypothetical protein
MARLMPQQKVEAAAPQCGFFLRYARSEIHALTPVAMREALINVGRDRLIPPFKRRGGVR